MCLVHPLSRADPSVPGLLPCPWCLQRLPQPCWEETRVAAACACRQTSTPGPASETEGSRDESSACTLGLFPSPGIAHLPAPNRGEGGENPKCRVK